MKHIHFKRKHLVILLLVLLLGSGGAYAVLRFRKPAPTAGPAPQSQPLASGGDATAGRIRLIAAGDFIAHDSVNAAAIKPDASYDYLQLMDSFSGLFSSSDIRFCNDPILNGGKALGLAGYPKFNSPTEFVADMGRLGCNVVNTASNHSFDFTQKYIDASVAAWDGVPNMLAVAGQNRTQAEHDTVHMFTVKGVKFAFLAYTTYSNSPPQTNYGVNMYTSELAAAQIATAKSQGAQMIVASMRWGTEYSGEVNAAQKQQAQFLADQGVDLVLGHGPHVTQAATQLTGKTGNSTTIFYSLGNFLNTQIPAETQFNGVAIIDFDISSRKVSKLQYTPIYMHYEWTPAQAAGEVLSARRNVKLYPLDSATQLMIDAHQLKTTAEAQRQRLQNTLNSMGLTIPFVSLKDLD